MNLSPFQEPTMFDSTSAFTLVGAVIGASAYGKPLSAAAPVLVPTQAVESIQRARVAIYCGHRLQAVTDIREAGQQLRASGAHVSPETLALLDEAAWLTRRDQHVLAERSLDNILDRIALQADSGPIGAGSQASWTAPRSAP
jgi:hypothetical protein